MRSITIRILSNRIYSVSHGLALCEGDTQYIQPHELNTWTVFRTVHVNGWKKRVI